jgi:hypothetical protein
MRVFVDVYDASGNKVGEGPIRTASGVSVSRELDGLGSISFQVPATDPRTAAITHGSIVGITLVQGAKRRELGRGFVTSIDQSEASGDSRINIDCPDDLQLLQNIIVGRAKTYQDVPLGNAVNDLAGKAGWTALVDGLNINIEARFDGSSLLKALQTIAEEKGLHFRRGEGSNVIEFGVLGKDNGITVRGPKQILRYDQRADIAYVHRLDITSASESIATEILPLGGGEGEAAITLAKSTRSGDPYVIEVRTGDSGRKEYWLVDTAARAKYGVRQRMLTFKNINPVSNSQSGLIRTANALYDAAAAWLKRNSIPQTTYSASAKGVNKTIRPGDRIRIVYDGMVWRDGKPYRYMKINDLFWVLSVSESVGDNSLSVDLKLSDVDQQPDTEAGALIKAMENLQVRERKPITTVSWVTQTYYDYTQGSDPVADPIFSQNSRSAKFRFATDELMTDIIKVIFRFRTSPFVIPATITTSGVWSPNYNSYMISSPVYPRRIKLFVNGVDVTTKFGGPWNDGDNNVPVIVEADITDEILAAGVQNDHLIEVLAGQGNGAWNYPGYAASTATYLASNGYVEGTIRALVVTQAIISVD